MVWAGSVLAAVRTRGVRVAMIWFLAMSTGMLSGASFAQSTGLLQVSQRFEEARVAGDNEQALRLGNEALTLAATTPDQEIDTSDLLIHLGEVQTRLGQRQPATQSYERALALLEVKTGRENPDLVPLLQSLADLYLADATYAQAETTLQRVLAIERAAYGEHSADVVATLEKLRAVYTSAGRTDQLESIDKQIRTASSSSRAVPTTRGKPRSDQHFKLNDGSATVRVFYGTNRAPTGITKAAQFYGTQRGELDLGYLDVSIPEIHKQGELETQSRWSMITYEADPDARRRFVLLNKVTPLSQDAFVGALQRQIRSAPSQDVFVFVHGFNSSFEDAARRTAQLAYDLDFDGTPMMYSWPSQASTTAYTVDEAAVGISSRKLAAFLETLVDKSGAARIHLIAHSMGNRALIESLETYLARRAPDDRKQVFGQIVFTAPDVDRDYFLETINALRESAQRVTLYASDNDLALKTSQKIHGAPRAGLAGTGIITLPWLDTIDMSAVPADMLGHSYFAANAGAIYDLFRMLWRDEPPAKRCGMVNKLKQDARVWRFNVDVCAGQDLLQAGVLFKRFGAKARARVRARINGVTDSEQKQEWSRILTRLDTLLPKQDE